MKVFLATLLVVGLASAALPNPKSIIQNLKAQLQQDVADIKAHTKDLVQQVSAHAKEDVAAVVKDPFSGFKVLIKNLSNDAKNVIQSSVADGNKVNEHIQTAINELKQVDTSKYTPILENLKQQLRGDLKDAKASVQALLKQALAHVGDDVKALLVDPTGAQKIIQENWNQDYNQFIAEGKKYVSTIQQQVQDCIDQLNKQMDQ